MARVKPLFPDKNAEPSEVAPRSAAIDRRPWMQYALWAAVAIAAAVYFWPRDSTPPGPVIDADGLYVLLVVDGNQRPTDGQGSVMNSVRIPDSVRQAGGQYRRYDRKHDLSTESEPWRAMQALATAPPQLVTLKNGRATVRAMPETIDAAVAIIEGLR